MTNGLYKRPDTDLPYNIDTRYFKHTNEGVIKEKYERRWVVLTTEVNDFIENEVEKSYKNLALSDCSREDRGPLTIVTANYGDNELSDTYTGDGELDWWTFGNGVYSYHIKRWVANDPTSIKNFCTSCVKNYGYGSKEVTVNCNPVAGEPRVMAEATFTPIPSEVEEDENDPTTGDGWGEDEEEPSVEESGESFNCSSSIDTLTPSAETYLRCKMNIEDARTILKIINGVEAGELVYKKNGDYGGGIKENGWYSADDTNPNAIENPVYPEGDNETKDNVDTARVLLKNIPDVMVPALRVTFSKKITSSQKLSANQISSSMTNAGTLSKAAASGGVSLPAPAITYGWDSDGTQYPVKSVEWLNEGGSFDGTSIRKKSSLTTGKTYYEGTQSESFRTVVTLLAYGETASSISVFVDEPIVNGSEMFSEE